MSELTDERLRQLREQPHGRDSVTVLALLNEIERLRVRAEGAEKALREIAMGSPVDRSGDVEWARAVAIAQDALVASELQEKRR